MGAQRGHALLRVVGGILTLVVVPAAWVVGVWWAGTKLNHAEYAFLTPLLFLVLVLVMPASIFTLARLLLAADARLARRAGGEPILNLRVPRLRDIRPRAPILEDESGAPLPAGRRLGGAALGLVMLAGTVAVLVGAPLASVWVVSQVAASTQPTMGAYAVVALLLCVTMLGGVRLLGVLQVAYVRVTSQAPVARRPRSSWLRSRDDERGVRRARRGLETVFVAVVILASLALAVWFVVLAGPTSYIPSELRPG